MVALSPSQGELGASLHVAYLIQTGLYMQRCDGMNRSSVQQEFCKAALD